MKRSGQRGAYLRGKNIPLTAHAPLAQGRTASDATLDAIGCTHGATAESRHALKIDPTPWVPRLNRTAFGKLPVGYPNSFNSYAA